MFILSLLYVLLSLYNIIKLSIFVAETKNSNQSKKQKYDKQRKETAQGNNGDH